MSGEASGGYTHDVVVIGAGAAGLTAAGGCAMLGLRVALIERGEMGGDCLNVGCVPSKALIAAAAAAQRVRDAAKFGVDAGAPQVDFAKVRAHVRGAIERIAPNDSPARFEALGVEVVAGEARFSDARTVVVGARTLRAPRIVIATGSRPATPDVPGLADVPYLTNETLWELDRLPSHLLVLGAGAIGMEMAQAVRRLDAAGTLVARERCLPRDDEDAARILVDRLRAEGVRVLEGEGVARVWRKSGGVGAALTGGETVAASHLLVATGRRVDLDGLNLEAAVVDAGADGIVVDARRRTSNPRIFAIGDCRAGPRFTHASGHEGSVAVLNIALGWPAKADYRALPHVTYTDPELAQVGMTEAEACAAGGGVTVRVDAFAHDDRSVCEGDTAGFVKTMWRGRRPVGATIVGAGAGDLLLPWTLAIRGKAGAFGIGQAIVAYPTRSERSKAAAFGAYEPLIFSRAAKRWAALLARARRRS